jgi:hypothetical protein
MVDADLAVMLADEGKAVTYKRTGATIFDPATGDRTTARPETATTALVSEISVDRATHSGGYLRVGDRVFGLRVADLGAEPGLTDQVEYDGDTYTVFGWTHGCLGRLYRVLARKS